MARAARGKLGGVTLDFGDGLILRWRPSHRWRVWRTRMPE
jgi:hypothetical protein